jgi:flagellar biosynthesis protein
MSVKSEKLRQVKKAVALRYEQEKDAVPRVVASGQGSMAERIISVARENNVEIHEDPDLIELLSKLDVDEYIPEKLFFAVAEVMAYVYRINNRLDDAKAKFGIHRMLKR